MFTRHNIYHLKLKRYLLFRVLNVSMQFCGQQYGSRKPMLQKSWGFEGATDLMVELLQAWCFVSGYSHVILMPIPFPVSCITYITPASHCLVFMTQTSCFHWQQALLSNGVFGENSSCHLPLR